MSQRPAGSTIPPPETGGQLPAEPDSRLGWQAGSQRDSQRDSQRNSQRGCRPGCGACCIAPSISSAIPGMPMVDGMGKPAGVRCVQLNEDHSCAIFDDPRRPAVCSGLKPSSEMCGDTREHALTFLARLDRATAPQLLGGEPRQG